MISDVFKDEIKRSIKKAIENDDVIENCISEHIEKNLKIDAYYLSKEIIDEFDIDSVCENIEKILLDRTLTFVAYPKIGDGEDGRGHRMAGEYACSSCYRPHGQWVGTSGVPHDPQVLKSGRMIIVAD